MKQSFKQLLGDWVCKYILKMKKRFRIEIDYQPDCCFDMDPSLLGETKVGGADGNGGAPWVATLGICGGVIRHLACRRQAITFAWTVVGMPITVSSDFEFYLATVATSDYYGMMMSLQNGPFNSATYCLGNLGRQGLVRWQRSGMGNCVDGKFLTGCDGIDLFLYYNIINPKLV